MPGQQIQDPCRRLEAALTEAGFPGLSAQEEDHELGPVMSIRGFAKGVRPPRAVIWMAFHVCRIELPCWACYEASSKGGRQAAINGRLCIDGECRNPQGPSRPPRELLCA